MASANCTGPSKVPLCWKDYEAIITELKAGRPAEAALPSRTPSDGYNYATYLEMYVAPAKAVSGKHDPKKCEFVCHGKSHPAGWFCEFCTKQPIQEDVYSAHVHWEHLQECTMTEIGDAGKTKEDRIAAREVFVEAISALDGYRIKRSRAAEKGKAREVVAKRPNFIAPAVKCRTSRKVQEPTTTRIPVNNARAPQRTATAQPVAGTSGTSQSRTAPALISAAGGRPSEGTARSSGGLGMQSLSHSTDVAGSSSAPQNAAAGRPPLRPPAADSSVASAPPTPRPSESPSVSLRDGERSAVRPAGQTGAATRLCIDLTENEDIDVKPNIRGLQASPATSAPIPGLPDYMIPYIRWLRIGGIRTAAQLEKARGTLLSAEMYTKIIMKRCNAEGEELDAIDEANLEGALERFLKEGAP